MINRYRRFNQCNNYEGFQRDSENPSGCTPSKFTMLQHRYDSKYKGSNHLHAAHRSVVDAGLPIQVGLDTFQGAV
jgi:hypothetical protein